jgi:hypothetical protein
MDMDKYIRSQVIMSNLILNLHDLREQHEELLTQINMVKKVIEKHESYIKVLKKDMEG